MLMAELVFDGGAPEPQAGEPFQRLATPEGDDWALLYRVPQAYWVCFPEIADFKIAADMQLVTCRLHDDTDRETAGHLFRNQVWPLMQSHLGKLVFHASAVLIEGKAVAFVGVSGRGKSTLAAAFAAKGYPFLADDGLVVSVESDGFWVESGLNSVRLWEDSVIALQTHLSLKAPDISFSSKARYFAADGLPHYQGRIPLACIFLLSESTGAFSCVPMDATECLVEWLRHSFILDVEDRTEVSRHFDGLARLAMDVKARRLDYPRSYAALELVRAYILRQLEISHEHA
jgi:hypothetical protein